MDAAIEVSLGVMMLSAAFVAIGVIGKLLMRDVSLDEMRTDKLWRGDRAAWSVRLLRPATIVLALSVATFAGLLLIESL